MEDPTKGKLNQLTDYIMKNCLWQFHSRKWDREKQNEGVLSKTTQLLCDEPVELETPADRCYWADAVCLADAYKSNFTWIADMNKDQVKQLMKELKDRIDYLTITGSLNAELTDPRY
ncbi:Fe-only nitrogenase subunit delta [Clostridium sp.]|uniref:Fe-only nitrogenase subunit delta n=1 Tax=Clostridium sp. TaxID=1506 RepID=UPI0025910CB0|nr:Fe-only nitrogenase subunit delta [Clostridium sp.]